jgi:hypothetical protein
MRGSTARTIVAAMGAILGAGCGPAPYTIGPEEPVALEDPRGRPTVIVIPAAAPRVMGAGEAPAPAPSAPREDGWIPDLLPRFNPFVEKRTWVGSFDCPEGRTGLTLRVVDVRGTKVRAIFDFHHAQSDTSGQFLLAGRFDEHTGDTVFTPGAWIIHPDDYPPLPLVGRVSRDGMRFAGRVPFPGCGGFRLRAVE